MKKTKRLMSILLSVLMVVSAHISVMGITIGEEAEIAVSKVASKSLGNTTKSARKAQTILENEKYIFAVLESNAKTHSSAVQIYAKDGDGTLLKTIAIQTDDTAYYASIRSAYLYNDVLYVTWGNVPKSSAAASRTTGSASSAGGSVYGTYLQSPTIAYDVSNVTAETELDFVVVDKGQTYQKTHIPFTWGGFSYLDEANGMFYTSKFTGDALARRYYIAYNTDDVEKALKNSETFSYSERIYVAGLTINATQFIIKDRWLFEVLKVNGGWSAYSSTAYYEAEKTKMTGNNMVNVYDLTDVEVTASNKNVSSKLRGTYTTESAGANVIRDIEVIGDYMYVSTPGGIEVVSLAPAYAEGVTSEEPATLAASTTINTLGEVEGAAGVFDLDAKDNFLMAAYAGAVTGENDMSALEATDSGALVVYDTTNPASLEVVAEQTVSYGAAQISLNEEENVIYVLHDNMAAAETYKFVSLSAYNYTLPIAETPEISSVKLGESDKVTAGTYDITVDISNASGVNGKLICAIYKGNQLDKVLISDNAAPNGIVTMAEDYVVDGEVTKVKAMFFIDMELTLQPICASVEITK